MILTPSRQLAVPCKRCGKLHPPNRHRPRGRRRFAPRWRRGVPALNMPLQVESGAIKVMNGSVVLSAGGETCCCDDDPVYYETFRCDNDERSGLWVSVVFNPDTGDIYVFRYNGACYYTSDEEPPSVPGTIVPAPDIVENCEDPEDCCARPHSFCDGDPLEQLTITFSGITLCPEFNVPPFPVQTITGNPNQAFVLDYLGESSLRHWWCGETSALTYDDGIDVYTKTLIYARFNDDSPANESTWEIVMQVFASTGACTLGYSTTGLRGTVFRNFQGVCMYNGRSVDNFNEDDSFCHADLGGDTRTYLGYGGTATVEWDECPG